MLRPGELAPSAPDRKMPSVGLSVAAPYTYRVLLAHIAALKMKKILQMNIEELFVHNKTNFFK